MIVSGCHGAASSFLVKFSLPVCFFDGHTPCFSFGSSGNHLCKTFLPWTCIRAKRSWTNLQGSHDRDEREDIRLPGHVGRVQRRRGGRAPHMNMIWSSLYGLMFFARCSITVLSSPSSAYSITMLRKPS